MKKIISNCLLLILLFISNKYDKPNEQIKFSIETKHTDSSFDIPDEEPEHCGLVVYDSNSSNYELEEITSEEYLSLVELIKLRRMERWNGEQVTSFHKT